MFCPSCEHENIAGADVCERCGADLSYQSAPVGRSALERNIMERSLGSLQFPPPLTVSLNTTLSDVVKLLVREGRGAVLVTHENALLGIFSERDLLMKIGERYEQLRDRPIREFMTSRPESLRSEDPVAVALNRMDVGHFRHIPILKDSEPVGLISIRLILRQLASSYLATSVA